jgi:hypothetical protein
VELEREICLLSMFDILIEWIGNWHMPTCVGESSEKLIYSRRPLVDGVWLP